MEDNTQNLLTQGEAALLLGLKNPRTMAAWRLRRCGPPYRRCGRHLVRYDRGELLAWTQKVDA